MPLKKQLYLTGGGGDRGVAAVGDDAEKEAEAGGDVGPSATPLASSIKMFSAAAMELGEVLGLQGLTVLSTKEGDLSLIKRAAGNFTQAAAAASYPSLFLDEQKMLRFAKAAHTLPSGLDFGRENEQRFLLSRTKMPFIPSQWMELEHQVLIYKYLNAKAPIPSSLLISISKSFRSSANRMSWRLLYQGFPNAESDPEPGRYRRTNGKKWRCSKEAMADHKYSERHINRNCHRSRKPVENQSRKTVKETPCAGSLPSSVGQGSFKKTKVNEMKPGSISYWTDSLNRNQLYIGHGTCGLIGNGNVLLISNCCASLPLPSARPCSSRRYTTRIFDSVE